MTSVSKSSSIFTLVKILVVEKVVSLLVTVTRTSNFSPRCIKVLYYKYAFFSEKWSFVDE